MAGNPDAYESLKTHSANEKVEYDDVKNVGSDREQDVKDPVYLDLDDDDYLKTAKPDVYDTIDDGQVLDLRSHKNIPLPSVRSDKPQPAPDPAQASSKSSKKRLAIIIGVVNSVVLIAIVVVVAVFLTRDNGPGNDGATVRPTDPFPSSLPALTTAPGDIPTTTASSGLTTDEAVSRVSTNSPIAPIPTITSTNLGTGIHDFKTCLNSADCWVKYDFLHDDMYYPCLGERYVRYLDKYKKYVGVRICEVGKRYHLFLANNMTGFFENVGDSNGSGEDHCEFLGGDEDANVVAPPYGFIDMEGYYRSARGNDIRRGTLRRFLSNARFVPWIECPGINIPTESFVVQADSILYPPTSRECYISAILIEEPIGWRHTTTPMNRVTGENPSFYTFSCSAARATDVELHVLSIYESSYTRAFGVPDDIAIPFEVTLEPNVSLVQRPITLVLASYRTIEWRVSVRDVDITRIVVMGHSSNLPYTSVNFTDTASKAPRMPPIEKIEKYLGYGGRKSRDTKDYLIEQFGPITSFIGRYSPAGYGLVTGTEF